MVTFRLVQTSNTLAPGRLRVEAVVIFRRKMDVT